MKISETKSTQNTRRASRLNRSATPGSVFELPHDDEIEGGDIGVRSVGTMLSIGDVSVLLALQNYENGRQQRHEAIRQGFDTLDLLDSLKVDLLSGRIDRRKLTHLMALVEKQRNELNDPELSSVLDQIELRARVELAKLEAIR